MDNGKEAAIWISDLSGANAPRRLTFQGANRYPVWSADGERVAFQSDREGDLAIFWQRADGTGTAERLTKPENGIVHFRIRFLPTTSSCHLAPPRQCFRRVDPFASRPESDSLCRVFIGVCGGVQFSPDGRWVAYSVDFPTGAGQHGLRPGLPGCARQISNQPRNGPLWSRDGKQLSFSHRPRHVLRAVNVTTEGGFAFTSPIPVPRGGLQDRPPDPEDSTFSPMDES